MPTTISTQLIPSTLTSTTKISTASSTFTRVSTSRVSTSVKSEPIVLPRITTATATVISTKEVVLNILSTELREMGSKLFIR